MAERIGGKFLRFLNSMMLLACGLAAASAAHAGLESAGVATPTVLLDAARQCDQTTEHQALARFETGTTFLLTENGLVAIKRPAAKQARAVEASWEPESLNTGN